MTTNLDKIGAISVLSVTGKLDSNTSPEFESQVVSLIDSGHNAMLLDLGELQYISSAGLRVLLLAAKKLKASGGRIGLASLKDHVREVFQIAGFTALFPIFATRDEGVKNL